MQIVELKVNVEKSQLEALAAEVEKLNGKVINFKTSTGGTGGASPTAGINKGLKETSQQAEKTGQSIMSVVGKVAKWTAVTTAVYAPVKAFKEALGTLKEVDSQLVQVQKVTSFSQRQMKEIEQQAYKTASAYGVSADKYTESVAAFARAGYKEQSAGLAELSTKTQLVGDTTAEVANQFLLSTDAAYQYNGSIEKLSKVLDGANQLDNNYATSIEKIAEGMGLVAPVAAQAGIGVDELMASLGTITAVTQRSGAEAARAYRALVLNILGDTKTEIADGATWTAGEIEGLRDVLKTYAPEAVKAAEATGDIINPMKAMEGLSQAMKDGVLTEQKLMEMVSDIGGKLRTSQLLALIQNWDMYESMLKDFQNAAGSADKEVENAMNSWERKTEVLKNTWTEFVSHMVDTDLIKGGLDGVTKVVEVLDSDFGQAAIKVAAVSVAVGGLAKAFTAVKGALVGSALLKDIGLFAMAFSEVFASQGIIAALGQTLALLGPIGIAIAGIVAAVGTMKLADFFTVDYSEQVEKVKGLKNEYDELYGTQSEYQQLVDKQASGQGLDDWEQRRLDYLKDYQKELRNQIELEKELAKEKYQQEYGDQRHVNEPLEDRPTGKRIDQKVDTQDVAMARDLAKAFKELNSEFESGAKGESEYKASIKELMDQYEDFVSLTREGLDEGWLDYGDLTDAQKQILDLYDALERLYSMDGKELRIEAALDSFEQAGDGVTQFANQVVVDGTKMRQAFMDAGLSAEDANRTIQELRDGGAVVIDVENDGIDQTLGYLEELGVAKQDVEGNWNIDFGDVQNLAKELGMSADEATTLAAELSKLGNVNVDGAVESTDRIATSVKELMNGAPYTFDLTATDNASDTVGGVKGEIESVPETHDTAFNGDASGVTGAASTADGAVTGVHKTWNTSFLGSPRDVVNKSGTAKSAVSTVPRSWSTTFSGNTGPIAAAVSRAKALIASLGSGVGPGGGGAGSGSAGLHKATGDLYFRGGPVLLGDELSSDGSPRPELVITKNGAFIAGMAGPVMTSLPAGSRILKYSDTLDVLSGSDMTRLQAFPGGTGTGGLSLSEIRARGQSSGGSSGSASNSTSKPSTSSGSSGSSRSSSPSSSRSSGSSRSGGRSGGRSSGSSGSSGGSGSSVDTLKEELELLEAQYSFLEASNASTEELWAKSDEIKGKLHEINEKLRSTGGKEKDIVDYSTKWWQEQEKIRETTQKFYEDQRKLLDTELEIMEASEKTLSNKTAEREEIEKTLQAYQQGGNVNLLKRPVIDASILRDVGWDDAGDGKATVFSSTFSNEDGSLAINFTPIIADKDGNFVDALEPDALWEYAEEVIEGVHDDYLGLQIGAAFTGEDAIEQAEKAAEEIHNLHEKYFLEDIWKEETIYESQIERIKAIQDSLHQEAEYLRSIGADQADINELSAQWWQELKKIHEVQRKVYQDERELLQSQSDLMEHQNKSAGERIAKLREIQDNLHQEAEYMRSIKADQAEINQLSIQWWETQEQILQIQKDLAESLDATVRARLRQIGDEKDDAIETIRDQIKEIEKERDSKLKELIEVKYKDLELNRDDLDLEQAKLDAQEKRNKLLEAEQNLRNAMNDRSVRYYNAATGQWEWGADAKKVKQAQEELDRAKKDSESAKKDVRRQEYELERKRLEAEYDKRIEEREAVIDKLTDEFDDLEKEWERMYDAMFGDAFDNIEGILQQMLDTGVITDAQAQEIRAFWNKINGFAESIDLTTSEILKTLKSWKQFQEEMPEATPPEYINYLTDFLNENGWSDENYNAAVSMAKAMAGETGASSQLAVLAARKAKVDAGHDPYDQGYDEYDPSTASSLRKALHDAVEGAKASSSSDSGRSSSSGGAAAAARAAAAAASSVSSGSSGSYKGSSSSSSSSSSGRSKLSSGTAKKLRNKKFDSGGILDGFGGIKATARDEIVIPPDLAEFMLKPSANKTFQSRVSELAYLYGSKPIPGTLSNNRSSNDHYGDTYTFGNVTLTEDKAKNTTVYELAQMSRSLGIYRNG